MSDKKKTVALAGCGGGYDIFGALPLYFEMVDQVGPVILINFSFTDEQSFQVAADHGFAKRFSPYLYRVDRFEPQDGISQSYFPEARLATCLATPVYAILIHTNPTLSDLKHAYSIILAEAPIDCIYLVDGGCDVLLRGSEVELGTPVEDMMHLKVIHELDIAEKYVMAVGVDIDMAHRVTLQDLDNRLRDLEPFLIRKWEWTVADQAVSQYCHVFRKCQPINSIVHSLVVAAIEGHVGPFVPPHLLPRITENRVSLTPRVCTAFVYPLARIASEVLYLERMQDNMNTEQVDDLISEFHHGYVLHVSKPVSDVETRHMDL
jgi:hypothetical protein